jgi:gamma-tubulin complex component 5
LDTAFQARDITRTVEAFADAVDFEIRVLDIWCADEEATICGVYTSPRSSKATDVVASLLHLSKNLSDKFEHTFAVLLHMIREVFSASITSSSEFYLSYVTAGARAPAPMTSKLLDVLFSNVQEHLEREEVVTSGRLTRIFVKTAEPVWGMCGKWLKDGMSLGLFGSGVGNANNRARKTEELDEEFFIEEKIFGFGAEGLVGLLHPQFWQEAYGLREGFSSDDELDGSPKEQKAVPMFLEHVAKMILSTGKAVCLIRALGSNVYAFGEGDWESFKELVGVEITNGSASKNPGSLFSVSVDTLSRLIYERLLPRCQSVGNLLVKILADECKLRKHLGALEDLFLMRRGDAISHFIDIIFNKVGLILSIAF